MRGGRRSAQRACVRASFGGQKRLDSWPLDTSFYFFFFLSSFSSANSQPHPMNYGVYFARCTPYYIPGSLKSAKNGSKKSSLLRNFGEWQRSAIRLPLVSYRILVTLKTSLKTRRDLTRLTPIISIFLAYRNLVILKFGTVYF